MINEKQNTVPLLLHDVAHQLRVMIDGKVEPYKLTRQTWVALSILEDAPGISQIELSTRLEIDRSSAGRLLERMEKRGLVYRQKDPDDRRIVRLYVTEEARPLLNQLNDVSSEIKTIAEDGFSQEEHQLLVRLLRKVQTNLKVGFGSFGCLWEFPEQAHWMMNLLQPPDSRVSTTLGHTFPRLYSLSTAGINGGIFQVCKQMFIRPIFSPLSGLMFILAGAMEIPALFDYFVHNKEWEAFQISAVVTLFTALALYVARDRDSSHFSLKHGYLFTVACWFLLPFFAALPFYWSTQEMTFTDAIFETISGLTTTGATILSGLENLPPGILLWRALLQWIGGIGIVVMAISIFPVLKTGGMQLFKLESSDTAGKVFPRIRDIAIGVFALYSGLTLICALIYFWEGMGIFDAIVHAMTTLSTGGFSTTDQSFAAFPDKGIIWTGSVFMFLGSVPFSLMLFSLKKRQWSLFFMDSQVQVYAAFVFIISLLCGYLYYKEAINLDFFTALTIATFNVISVITTTGYAIGDYSLWGAFAPVLFFFLTFVGGCSGSTAGGIKMFRFHVLWLSCLQQLRKLIYPNGVFLQKIDGKPLSNELSQSVLIYVFMLIISFAIIATSLSFTGLDFITALSGAATALSNVGPGLGSSIGPAGNFQSLPDSAKWILDIAMVLGRLEYVTIIVLLQASFWRYQATPHNIPLAKKVKIT